ncbi:MAG: esterase [Chloroflexi bacterium]|nr:esterase [Chloroflexota bacterium]
MPDETTPTHHYALQRAEQRAIDARGRHITIESKTLGVSKGFYIALPPGYNRLASARERYPVLYLFRGHEREWVHRWQDKSRRGRTLIDLYRALLADGKVGPMILVFPGISSDDNRVPGILVNFRAPELAQRAPGIGTGRFEDYFLKELVPYIDSRFRTLAERGARAVDGFSLGGFAAIKIAAQHPELFVSAGAFDGTFLYAINRGKAVRANDRVIHNPIFAPAFGMPRDMSFITQNSPANLLWRNERDALAGIQWMIRSGPQSAEPWQSNYFRAQHVIGILQARGLENAVGPVLARSKHNWHWADKHIESTLPLHWAAMKPALEAARVMQVEGQVRLSEALG